MYSGHDNIISDWSYTRRLYDVENKARINHQRFLIYQREPKFVLWSPSPFNNWLNYVVLTWLKQISTAHSILLKLTFSYFKYVWLPPLVCQGPEGRPIGHWIQNMRKITFFPYYLNNLCIIIYDYLHCINIQGSQAGSRPHCLMCWRNTERLK